jgi:hypothetical protein
MQRSYQRWLDKRICKTEMKFWAVLGSWGCREKKLPTGVLNFLKKYPSVRTKKLHNSKLRKILKNI